LFLLKIQNVDYGNEVCSIKKEKRKYRHEDRRRR
jgi:hypothetical protein